ncbi:MAG: class I SAM-dependent methyltransferase [Candidatus Desulfofervidaceae bacterium]|nr:class I SAM-dependent methyltransferase [Candidatus Desulfofervidaceae bacterium]
MQQPYDEIAPLYDSEFTFNDDVYFYLNYLSLPPRRILEVGCGTGRIAVPLAQNGHEVIGIDISLPMLRVAKEKKVFPFYPICMDMRCLGLKGNFDFILMPFNVLGFLTTSEERLSFLKQLIPVLNPNGKIIIDLFVPSQRKVKTKKYVKKFVHTTTGTLVIKQTQETYNKDRIKIEQVYKQYEYGKTTPLHTYRNNFSLAIIDAETLETELLEAGLWIEEMFGDYIQTPFNPKSSPRLLAIAAIL